MYIEELLILIFITVAIVAYRNYKGQDVRKFIVGQVQEIYDKFAPYSFKVVRQKAKDLGQEFTPRQYLMQILILGGFAGVV